MRTTSGPGAAIAAVLWDCDGVLQHGMRGALADLAAVAGPDALPALLAAEGPALRGEERLRDCVGRVIAQLDLAVTVDEVLPVWDRYRLDEAALEVLAAVRAAGVPCYLATNQQDYRRDRMRTVSGYDDLVDGSFYSCEMGVAKPDPGFFRYIVTALAHPPGSLLFLDDLPENVAAARDQGLHAELVGPGDVAPQLRAILGDYGVGADAGLTPRREPPCPPR